MISHRYKCIFVHIPRCGGSSIEKIIWPEPRDVSSLWMGSVSKYYNKYQTGGLQHLFSSHICQEVGEDIFQRYFKFSIIRNPWDKAASQYFYIKHRPDLREFLSMKEDDSFKRYLDLIQKKVHVQWEHQYKFIMNENGDLMVDYLGRFETFNHDVSNLLERLEITANIPHINATSHEHYREYYDQETIEMIADFYSEDIRTFGYAYLSH